MKSVLRDIGSYIIYLGHVMVITINTLVERV